MFGLDSHSNGKSSPVIEKQSPSSSISQANSSSNKRPEPAPVRPSQVSLSLEEKQRLQKEQEFQQRLKNQKAIQPEDAVKQPSRSTAKDLTGSLMDSRSKGQGQAAGVESVGMGTRTGGSGNTGLLSSGISSMNSSPYSPSGTMSAGSVVGTGGMGLSNSSLLSQPVGNVPQRVPQMGQPSQTKKNIDMSAFDSLLAPSQSQKSNRTLNQMSSANSPHPANPPMGQNSFQRPQVGMAQAAFGQGSQGGMGKRSQGGMGQGSQGGMGQRSQGGMGQGSQGGMGQGSQGGMGQRSQGGMGQGSQGGMGQGSFGNMNHQGQGAFGQQGMMGNYGRGSAGTGQRSLPGSTMQQQGTGMAAGFDPFASIGATSQQNQKTVGGDNLLDFLG
ncbi:spidroin-1-like [Lytechinus variegatus]|uniref:spidroin-1-like n=1 Tax=Lytechinus variegatus TaxID=7654 RepID=UPI001BB216F3|nr:spidroin-1-like [Lytechinus variegatus]